MFLLFLKRLCAKNMTTLESIATNANSAKRHLIDFLCCKDINSRASQYRINSTTTYRSITEVVEGFGERAAVPAAALTLGAVVANDRLYAVAGLLGSITLCVKKYVDEYRATKGTFTRVQSEDAVGLQKTMHEYLTLADISTEATNQKAIILSTTERAGIDRKIQSVANVFNNTFAYISHTTLRYTPTLPAVAGILWAFGNLDYRWIGGSVLASVIGTMIETYSFTDRKNRNANHPANMDRLQAARKVETILPENSAQQNYAEANEPNNIQDWQLQGGIYVTPSKTKD